MSKFDPVWDYVSRSGEATLTMTFDQVEAIAGVPIDHSFLTYKKELLPLGYEVEKISLKGKTVRFRRLPQG